MKDLSLVAPDFNFNKDVIYDDEKDVWLTPRDLSGMVFVARNIIANEHNINPWDVEMERVFVRNSESNHAEVFKMKVINSMPYWQLSIKN